MDVDLMASLDADHEKSVLVLVGTGYFQMVNNAYYPLANGQYNALTISQVIMP